MSIDAGILKLGQVATFIYDKDDADSMPEWLGSYLALDATSKDEGALNPMYKKMPDGPSHWVIVDFTHGQPGLGTSTINEKVLHSVASYVEKFKDRKCRVVIINSFAPCGNQDEIDNGRSWQVIDGASLTNVEFSAMGSLTAEDAEVTVNGPVSFLDVARVFPVRFTEQAGTTIAAEGLSVVYCGAKSCGSCSPSSNGCTKYILTRANSGSPGLSSQIVKVTEKNVVSNYDITTLGGKSGNKLVCAGARVAVVSEADGAHHVAKKNNLSAWTRISSGYVGGGAPRAIWVGSSKQIVIGGAGGYIYYSENIAGAVTPVHSATSTTQPVNAVHGKGETVLTVHDSNTIMVATNGGRNFSLLSTAAGLAGPEAGANLTAVWVKTRYWWEVGTNTGKIWYTVDGGLNWAQRVLPIAVTVINDIQYSDELPDEVGVICAEDLTQGYVLRTYTGGRYWSNDDNVITGLPLNRRCNSAALCGRNEVSTVGLLQASTDGFLATARN